MNKQRRQRIGALCDKLDALQEELDSIIVEERKTYDELLRSIAGRKLRQESSEAIDAMDDAHINLLEALDHLLEQRA